jgi:hypothetical protein
MPRETEETGTGYTPLPPVMPSVLPPPPQRQGFPLQIGGLTARRPQPQSFEAPPSPAPRLASPPPVFPSPPPMSAAPPMAQPVSPPTSQAPSTPVMAPPAPNIAPSDLSSLIGQGVTQNPSPAAQAQQQAPSITTLPPEVLAMLASIGFFSGPQTGDTMPFGRNPRPGLFGGPPPAG